MEPPAYVKSWQLKGFVLLTIQQFNIGRFCIARIYSAFLAYIGIWSSHIRPVFASYPVRENKNPRIAVLKTELESYNV